MKNCTHLYSKNSCNIYFYIFYLFGRALSFNTKLYKKYRNLTYRFCQAEANTKLTLSASRATAVGQSKLTLAVLGTLLFD